MAEKCSSCGILLFKKDIITYEWSNKNCGAETTIEK